jgi:hypothetical protein
MRWKELFAALVCAQASGSGWQIGDYSIQVVRLCAFARIAQLNKEAGRCNYGGGGGSRTRVRNRCQQKDSMLSRLQGFRAVRSGTDKTCTALVR